MKGSSGMRLLNCYIFFALWGCLDGPHTPASVTSGVTSGACPDPSISVLPECPPPSSLATSNANMIALSGATTGTTWTTGIGAQNEAFLISNAPSVLVATLPMTAGDRILGVRLKVFGTGQADVHATAFYVSAAMVGSQIGVTSTSRPAQSWSTVSIDVGQTGVVVGDLDAVDIRVVATGSGIRVGNVAYVHDRPVLGAIAHE